MRAAPAIQVSLRRFGQWRAAVLALGGLAIAALCAWLNGRPSPIDAGVFAVVGLSAMAIAALAVSLARVAPMSLRWDGLAWHLADHDAAKGDALPGDIDVAFDLGPWMLLRFKPTAPGARPRIRWLPVQRRGIESQWHGLRCAVYSPRPEPGAGQASES